MILKVVAIVALEETPGAVDVETEIMIAEELIDQVKETMRGTLTDVQGDIQGHRRPASVILETSHHFALLENQTHTFLVGV